MDGRINLKLMDITTAELALRDAQESVTIRKQVLRDKIETYHNTFAQVYEKEVEQIANDTIDILREITDDGHVSYKLHGTDLRVRVTYKKMVYHSKREMNWKGLYAEQPHDDWKTWAKMVERHLETHYPGDKKLSIALGAFSNPLIETNFDNKCVCSIHIILSDLPYLIKD